MKIANSPDSKPPQTGAEKAIEAPRPAKSETVKKTPEASAKVELSNAASALGTQEIDDGSFDAAKVQRISQAISEGKFTINAQAIADKLISNAQELVGRSQPSH